MNAVKPQTIWSQMYYLTEKKLLVEPQQYVPYLIFVCFARSSAELIGDAILDEVRKAEIMTNIRHIWQTQKLISVKLPARLAV